MKATIAPALALAALLSFAAAPAEAQLARTFVSNALGNDANNCDRPTPCRTFQRAHDNTLAGGDITVLDPGGYGAVTITRGISIINDGIGEGGVLVSGGATGITVAAGSSDAVSLRGLTIKGIGSGGGNGIVFNSGKSLIIENCAVRTLTTIPGAGIGIFVRPSTSATVTVTNTLVAQNVGVGIWFSVATSAVSLNGVLDRVAVYDGQSSGVLVDQESGTGSNVQVTAVDSIAAGNASDGFVVQRTGEGTASLVLTRSTSANNTAAGLRVIGASRFASLTVGESTITGNGSSWSSSGTLQSYGDNNVIANSDGNPAIPTVIRPK